MCNVCNDTADLILWHICRYCRESYVAVTWVCMGIEYHLMVWCSPILDGEDTPTDCLHTETWELLWCTATIGQYCGCWWPGARAPGHQQPQCWWTLTASALKVVVMTTSDATSHDKVGIMRAHSFQCISYPYPCHDQFICRNKNLSAFSIISQHWDGTVS